jgi:hypothetical protein
MFQAGTARYTCRTYQFDVIGAFLQAKMRSRIFMKLPSICCELSPEYAAYCGTPGMHINEMYGTILS